MTISLVQHLADPIVNETEKAILVKLKDDPEKGVWLPKAHVGISKNTAKIPYWMTSLKKVTLW